MRALVVFSFTFTLLHGCFGGLSIRGSARVQPTEGMSSISLVSPSAGARSAAPTVSISGVLGKKVPPISPSTTVNIRVFLNDASCGAPNLVGTVAVAPGAAYSVTTSSLAAGGDGLKTLYYTIGEVPGQMVGCTPTGLSYTYQALPIVSFTRMGYTVTESGTEVGSPVTVQRDVCGIVTSVDVVTNSVSAMSGTNFSAGTTNVTFAAGDCAPKTIPASAFNVVSDGTTTGDLFFRVALGTITGGTLDPANSVAQVNLLDTGYPGVFSFNQPLYTVKSGDTSATLTILRSGSAASAVNVDLVFEDGTAVAGTDFTGTTQVLSFAIGESEKTVTVPIVPGSVNSSFLVKLENYSSGTGLRNMSVAKVRIMGANTTCDPAGVPFGGGSGAVGDPYLICTLTQLKAVSSNLASSFKMAADIASDGSLAPLGGFFGNFDGNEHIIENFRHTTGGGVNQAGLFDYIAGGTFISNLNLLNASMTNLGGFYTGIVVGMAADSLTMPTFTMSNLLVSGYLNMGSGIISGLIAGQISAGHFSGGVTAPRIRHVQNLISFGRVDSTTGSMLGGQFGYFSGRPGGANTFMVSKLYNCASVRTGGGGGVVSNMELSATATATMSKVENRGYILATDGAGGVFGRNVGDGVTTVFNATYSDFKNYGRIVSTGNHVGGIFGESSSIDSGTFTGFKNFGNVTGNIRVGGIIGYKRLGTVQSLVTISSATNFGTVSSSGYSGGMIGYLNVHNAINSTVLSLDTSSNEGSIVGTFNLGGLIGQAEFWNTSTATIVGGSPAPHRLSISSSSNLGSITGSSGGLGGLVGDFFSDSNSKSGFVIANSFSSSGAISCSDNICGGLVGGIRQFAPTESLITDSYSSSSVSGVQELGGVIGQLFQGSGSTVTLERSYSNGSATGTNYVAGIIGLLNSVGGTTLLTRVHSTGTITGNNGVGGLFGSFNMNTATGTITRSYSTGSVNGSLLVGGMGGVVNSNTAGNVFSVANSYTSGTVSASTNYASGGMGEISASGLPNCPALTITHVYTRSDFSSTPGQKVGLFGSGAGCAASITNSYWLKDTVINATVANDGNQRTAFDLTHLIGQSTATYTGWDFSASGPWNTFVEGNYPTLR